MKKATIRLHKQAIYSFIDAHTYKRVDATLNDRSDRTQNAVASDSEEDLDAQLIVEYCDRRDAELRRRLRFCLVPDEHDSCEECEIVVDNIPEEAEPDYIYKLQFEDNSMTTDAIKSLGKKMDEYIKRGAIIDWYLQAGLEPTDSEQALDAMLDDLVYVARGRAWGRKPAQPFGPAFGWNYLKKPF